MNPPQNVQARLSDKEKSEKIGRLRDYAWKQFSYSADQRMRCFNYFVLLIAALTTGTCAIASKADNDGIMWPLGIFVWIVASLFERLDKRNQQLVAISRYALMAIERVEGLDDVSTKIDAFRKYGITDLQMMVVDDFLKSKESHITRTPLCLISDSRMKNNPREINHELLFARFFLMCKIFGVIIIGWSAICLYSALTSAYRPIPPPGAGKIVTPAK